MVDNVQAGELGLNLIIYPSNLIGASRVGKIAKSLQASGQFDATIAVGMLNLPDLPETEELAPEAQAVRLSVNSYRGPGGWVIGQLLWPGRVIRKFQNQNIAVVSAQRVSVLRLAYKLSKKTGAVFAYNAHELETEVLGFSGLKQQIAKFLERRYIRRTDIVSVVNDSIADWYENEYPGLPRPIVLTNTPIDDGRAYDLKAKLGIPENKLLYVHVGYISPGRNIPLILKEFANNPNVHVVFLGDGDLRHLVEEATTKHANIHWHPMVPPDSVVAHVRGADIGLCLIESAASLSDELSTPNKLLESWVAGIPPLSSGLKEAKRLLGPELSDTWILDTPEEQLSEALQGITLADVADFKTHWKPVPSWDEQVVQLVEGYRQALKAKQQVK